MTNTEDTTNKKSSPHPAAILMPQEGLNEGGRRKTGKEMQKKINAYLMKNKKLAEYETV